MFLGNKIIILGKFVLKVLQESIIKIGCVSADDTNEMVVVFATVFTFELFYLVTKIYFGTKTIVPDQFNGPIDTGSTDFIHVQISHLLIPCF